MCNTIASSINVYDDDSGELIFEDLHNRTVIAECVCEGHNSKIKDIMEITPDES